MKIQYCSDLHLEFKANEQYLHRHPVANEGDVLILAGDIMPLAYKEHFSRFLDDISERFETVYWLPGNHEYYGFDMGSFGPTVHEKIRDNVFLVNNLATEYKGITLLFATLWSRISPPNEYSLQQAVADFSEIMLDKQVLTPTHFNKMHTEALDFLKTALPGHGAEKTIIITHHVPTFMNYPAKYKGQVLNEAFATELHDFIIEAGAAYWVYGHHHYNVADFTIGYTRMVTNQLGYVKYHEQEGYKNDKTIEI